MASDLVTSINWTGSLNIFTSGASTPFGLYDTDAKFPIDAPRVSDWVAKRLGYPVQNVELLPENIFACFEEATSEYSAQVNAFNIRNNLYNMLGHDNTDNLTDTYIEGANTTQIITISTAYGAEANVGGGASIYKGHIELQGGIQRYDLKNISPTSSVYESGSGQYFADVPSGSLEHNTHYGQSMTITKIFYEGVPAISRFFDPYAVSAKGTLNLMDEFGFSSFSPAAQFVLMPVYEDLLRIQAIEFNDMVRRSGYSFNLVNNILEIFPIPGTSTYNPQKLYFEYVLTDERTEASVIHKPNVISNYANIRYDNMTYNSINSVGKQWIWKYTLALAKELLGAIREKYNEIPIPDGSVTLDGAALRAEAQVEKDELIKKLRENLEELSKKNQYEIEKNAADFEQDMLRKIPLKLYKG